MCSRFGLQGESPPNRIYVKLGVQPELPWNDRHMGYLQEKSFRPQVEPVYKKDHVCCRWLGCRMGLPKPVKAHIVTLCAPDAGHTEPQDLIVSLLGFSLALVNLSM